MKKVLLIILASLSVLNLKAQMNKSERYSQGWKNLQTIDGEAGEKVVDGLRDISPELSRFIIEYAFGDVYNLSSLNTKSKEIAAISSLIASGTLPQLKVHLNGALNVGCSINEVKEVILQMSAYVGFPKSINAMNALREVLNEHNIRYNVTEEQVPTSADITASRYDTGAMELALLDNKQEKVLKDAYADFSPELVQFVIEYGYGDLFSRGGLSKKNRQIASIAALTTLGNAQPQLKFHIKGGLQVGLKPVEINEIMLLMSVYAGFPAAINGTNTLKEVLELM